MTMPTAFRGILVRHQNNVAMTEASLQSLSPAQAAMLRPHLADLAVQPELRAPGGRSWSAMTSAPNVHPWDAAHAAAAAAAAENNDPHAYAEPNYLFSIPDPLLTASAAVAAVTASSGPLGDPRLSQWTPNASLRPYDWHLDKSGLRAARAAVVGAVGQSPAKRVRIGHLDTGYSDVHETKPTYLLANLARDITINPPTGNAIDPATTTAPISSPGHGTATLALMAGAHCTPVGGDLGGAPFAEIVPVRMSDYVWHVWTDAIPKAIDWALKQDCQILNLCHGGLATQAWADAVNAAYEAGVFVVAASGDNFGGLPLRDVVWPARFRRAIAVTGVTYDGSPYFNNSYGIGVMEGNFGPASAMGYAIVAYTPNVLWPKCKDKNTGTYTVDWYDLDGGGTSASTPQVTAAIALYLQQYQQQLAAIPDRIQRLETVRAALFQSATASPQSDYLGYGILNAEAMLALSPSAVTALPNLARDEISFELLTTLVGWSQLTPGQQKMLEVEATQIAASHPFIARTIAGWEAHSGRPQGSELVHFLTAFQSVINPRPSALMYQLLDNTIHQ